MIRNNFQCGFNYHFKKAQDDCCVQICARSFLLLENQYPVREVRSVTFNKLVVVCVVAECKPKEFEKSSTRNLMHSRHFKAMSNEGEFCADSCTSLDPTFPIYLLVKFKSAEPVKFNSAAGNQQDHIRTASFIQTVDSLPLDFKLYAASKRMNRATLQKVKELVNENLFNKKHLLFYFTRANMVNGAYVPKARCNPNASILNHFQIPASISDGDCSVFPRPRPKTKGCTHATEFRMIVVFFMDEA